MAKSFLFHFNIFEAIFSNTACLLIRYLLSSELFIFYTTVFCFFYILCVFSWASCKSAWGEKKCITGNLKFNQMAVKKFAQTDATNSANLITGTWTDATFKNLWYLFFREHWQELHHHKTHTHTHCILTAMASDRITKQIQDTDGNFIDSTMRPLITTLAVHQEKSPSSYKHSFR